MHVRCPHCQNAIEIVDESELRNIECATCGSSFSLLGGESTVTYHQESKSIGHFELLEQLGIGAFGTVWKAHDTKLDRIVAVKIPRNEQVSDAETTQFLHEARSAAQLNHPNIVSVHEVGREDDQVFIVSDFVHGATLSDWVQSQSLSTKEAAELCAKIADALDHAHASGVVHRDLKPGNIMMDLDCEPHIMDFGLAKRDSGEITMTVEGRILGTPAYMPPEQARGDAHNADARSDVYSLGVILFRLLTGELPFRGSPSMLIVQILKDDPPRPSKLNGNIPKDLETICLKCLEKDPRDRFQNAGELKEELQRFICGNPILARPLSGITRAWRWANRNRALSSLSATLCIFAISLSVTLMIMHRRGRDLAANEVVERLLEAPIHQVPGVLQELEPLRKRINSILAAKLSSETSRDRLLRIRLGLLPTEPLLASVLVEDLLSASHAEFPVILQKLHGHRFDLVDHVSSVFADISQTRRRRISASMVLARWKPASQWSQNDLQFVSDNLLVGELNDISFLWRQLAPITSVLRERPLKQSFLENVSQRSATAFALLAPDEFATTLADLCCESTEEFPALLHFERFIVNADSRKELIARLKEIARTEGKSSQALAVIALTRLDELPLAAEALARTNDSQLVSEFVRQGRRFGIDKEMIRDLVEQTANSKILTAIEVAFLSDTSLLWQSAKPSKPEPAANERSDISGPVFQADDSGGIVRRAISDSWVLDHSSTYKRGGPPVFAELKTALKLVQDLHKPGDVEVPVDTDQDGRPNVWVYFDGDKPAFVEADRFDTGCHDFRVTLATGNVAERSGWETSPPVPINVDVPVMPLADLFDWVAPNGQLPGGPTRFSELAGRVLVELPKSLPALAEQNRADNDLTNKINEFARNAIKLQPQFLNVHRERDYDRKLRRPWGHQQLNEGFDLNGDGDGKNKREVLVGFAPSGVVRIQFYEKDWRESDGFVASVEFDGRAVESVQYQDRRYYAVGDFWVRPDEAIRPALAQRYLAPGYRQWRSKNWYAAVRLWQRGTELAALIGDLPIDEQGHPRAKLAKWPRGTGFMEFKHGWNFEIDGLPAASLLSVSANLAWMRADDLTSRLRDLAEHATARREYFEALAHYRLALRFARKLGESTTQVNTLESMAEIFRHVGNYDLALDCLNESVEIESSLAYARDIVKNLEMLTPQNAGNPDAGNAEAVRMTMQMRSHAMTLNRGCKLGTIAALHADMGNRKQAEGYLAESQRLIQSVGDKYCEADLLNLQASWDIADGRWEIAQQRLERVLQMITDEMQVQQEHDRGQKLLEAGQAMHKFVVPGKRTFLEVGMRSRTSPESYRALSATLMAELLLQKSLRTAPDAMERKKLLAEAMRWQNQALDWYAKGRDAAGRIVGRLHLATILTHRQEYEAALELNRQVTEEARQVRAFETVWKSLALDGLIRSRMGDLDAAIAAYERAAEEIETVRAGIRSEAVRRGFFSSKLDVYERLASLYDRQRDGKPDDQRRALDLKIWNCMERAKARTLLDMVAGEPLHVRGEAVSEALRDNPLLAARLHGGGSSVLMGDLTSREAHEQFLQQLVKRPELQELASLTTVQPVKLDAVQSALGADDVLLEYLVTDDDLLVAVISHDNLTVYRIADYGRQQIQHDVEHYRRILEQLDPGFEAPAKNLYRRLLQPMLLDSDDARHICVVPTGPLHYVPFDAFLLPSGEFVTEKYVVSYAPSASALVYALHRPSAGGAETESQTLIVAEPAPRLDFGALPGAVIEGERIRDLALAPKTLIQGLQATETNVLAALENSRYFHFAGHTDLPPGGPMRAALLCTQDVDRDGRLEVREIFALDLSACEVAVLSACETRLGRWSRGDEIVGLERAFLRAGVPTVIASLWKVDDTATSLLMEEFYTNLWQKSLPRAEALSQAQLAIIHSPDRLGTRRKELTSELTLRGRRGPASSKAQPFTVETTDKTARSGKVVHPGYWAAFVLSGDWR